MFVTVKPWGDGGVNSLIFVFIGFSVFIVCCLCFYSLLYTCLHSLIPMMTVFTVCCICFYSFYSLLYTCLQSLIPMVTVCCICFYSFNSQLYTCLHSLIPILTGFTARFIWFYSFYSLYFTWLYNLIVVLQVFEELLLDADWSVNAGMWMWLSCSSFFQQFFHCYCPVGFGKRADPTGDFIR